MFFNSEVNNVALGFFVFSYKAAGVSLSFDILFILKQKLA